MIATPGSSPAGKERRGMRRNQRAKVSMSTDIIMILEKHIPDESINLDSIAEEIIDKVKAHMDYCLSDYQDAVTE